ncbi:hypothetical protein NQ318_000114 [Aromia moschata]|uniref:Carboxylic ester hydrolase n=1 Tax=Aromia moschata TaxID=1265417 RepID=A0AAV8XPK3_9CUCU|nr:hypothetical protein NQ318_000114 [Aromia moschata]
MVGICWCIRGCRQLRRCQLFKIFLSILAQDTIVTIKNGQVRGRVEVTARGKQFYAFERIPYEPAENWSGVFDASSANEVVCIQNGNTGNTQTEDCLYVNVYTPVVPSSNAGLPIIYYIFGGGFLNGKSTFYGLGPHYFVEKDVIVVTASYPLDDSEIPGNFGLKDQNLGLKWVQDNIQYFGGDPSKVTIMGESAGGVSVTLQTLEQNVIRYNSCYKCSKASTVLDTVIYKDVKSTLLALVLFLGLFRGAISQSGSALCPWAYQRYHKDVAYALATNIDSSFSPTASSEELLTFLQNATLSKSSTAPIITRRNTYSNVQPRQSYDQMIQGFVWGPVIEPQHNSAFLTEEMYTTIANGVPIQFHYS